MDDRVDLADAFGRFDKRWEPRIVATVNDYDVKIVHVEGGFREHVHEGTDEFFHVLAGRLQIEMPGRTVELKPGQVFTVPRGTPHHPVADAGTRILIFEPRGTQNTGDDSGTAGVPLES